MKKSKRKDMDLEIEPLLNGLNSARIRLAPSNPLRFDRFRRPHQANSNTGGSMVRIGLRRSRTILCNRSTVCLQGKPLRSLGTSSASVERSLSDDADLA